MSWGLGRTGQEGWWAQGLLGEGSQDIPESVPEKGREVRVFGRISSLQDFSGEAKGESEEGSSEVTPQGQAHASHLLQPQVCKAPYLLGA